MLYITLFSHNNFTRLTCTTNPPINQFLLKEKKRKKLNGGLTMSRTHSNNIFMKSNSFIPHHYFIMLRLNFIKKKNLIMHWQLSCKHNEIIVL
jgi:hypothetical protein